jgi:hypothetical protein
MNSDGFAENAILRAFRLFLLGELHEIEYEKSPVYFQNHL